MSLHGQRAAVCAIMLLLCLAWAAISWLVAPSMCESVLAPSVLWHKVASVIIATGLTIYLFLAVMFERTD